jgi:hypothetical protein
VLQLPSTERPDRRGPKKVMAVDVAVLTA